MKRIIISTAIILCAITVSWLAFGRNEKFKKISKASVVNDAVLTIADSIQSDADLNDDEKKIIKELQDLFKDVSAGKPLHMEGDIRFTDPVDTSQKEQASDFIFHNDGAKIYYKNKAQEAINDRSFYTVADHELKRLVVMPPKSVEAMQVIPLSALSKNIKAEGYSIERSEQGGSAIIRLLCEQHITCKEVSVEFDAATGKLISLFYRFTDLDHPEDTDFDKTLNIKISNWEKDIEQIRKYPLPQLVQSTKDGQTITSALEDYQVINLINK